ncbi:hypothetical protein PENSPDRAFT_749574 [Peniophora sp. CONT]|nr:hypothetical protein PENSPDRAFT_749574 [Peniophora sp. CONT]
MLFITLVLPMVALSATMLSVIAAPNPLAVDLDGSSRSARGLPDDGGEWSIFSGSQRRREDTSLNSELIYPGSVQGARNDERRNGNMKRIRVGLPAGGGPSSMPFIRSESRLRDVMTHAPASADEASSLPRALDNSHIVPPRDTPL